MRLGIGIGLGRFTPSVGGGFDPDAQAFFDRVTTAGGTLTTTEKNATNQLVLDMKSAGIWTSMKAVYPMVGASAAACAQNLKSSSFTGTFSSGWAFASTGVTPNGTSAYMNTNLNMASNLTNGSYSYGVYSRTNVSENSRQMGVSNGAIFWQLISRLSDNMYFDNPNAPSRILVSNTDSRGFYMASRTNTSLQTGYKNGVSIGTEATNISAIPLLSLNLYLSARNDSGTATAFATNQIAFCYVSDGLSGANASNFYTAVQAFQTTLARQVV